jgi:hypothetical protein
VIIIEHPEGLIVVDTGIPANAFGIVASLVYSLAQTELLATVIPGFPVAPQTGLIGNLLWLAWMMVTGIFLLRAKTDVAQ